MQTLNRKYRSNISIRNLINLIALILTPLINMGQTLPGNYTTSWIGNSVGGFDGRKIPDFVQGAWVDINGDVYTNTPWEEANCNVSVVYNNGDPGPRHLKGSGHEVGMTTGAICVDNNYFYHSIRNGFRRATKTNGSNGTYYLQDGISCDIWISCF